MKKSTPLSERIKNYSLFSSAMLASSLVADAQVIYTDISPDLDIFLDSYSLDLNNDGITDFVVSAHGFLTTFSQGWGVAEIVGAPGNEVAEYFSSYAKPIGYGENIGPGQQWYFYGILRYWSSAYVTSHTYGYFDNSPDYVGLHFMVDGQMHYGWLRLSVYNNANGFVLYEYGYEATPESSIKAGEIICQVYYTDADSDFYGSPDDPGVLLCSYPGTGYSTDNLDCNDTDPSINPGATEICNGIDENCSGSPDDLPLTTYYLDTDGDGYGNAGDSFESTCFPAGYVMDDTDCNDENILINPATIEICNGIDENCNEVPDDGLTFLNYYIDSDGDGYGNTMDVPDSLCSNPGAGYVTNNADCKDTDSEVYPGAGEICNGMDDDCDLITDDGLTFSIYYADSDSDGFGNASSTIVWCAPLNGFISDSTDCDDTNAAINPSATEICNGLDDDCNLLIDDGLTSGTYYSDADNDGFGDANNIIDSCAQPAGYITDSTDCDDSNTNVNPNALEIPNNGIDDNCDGYVDEIGVGITSIDHDTPALSVFPNPTNGEFVVGLQLDSKVNCEATIEVINLLGQVKFAKTSSVVEGKLQEEIQLNGAAKGIYLIKVSVNESVYSTQLIYQ